MWCVLLLQVFCVWLCVSGTAINSKIGSLTGLLICGQLLSLEHCRELGKRCFDALMNHRFLWALIFSNTHLPWRAGLCIFWILSVQLRNGELSDVIPKESLVHKLNGLPPLRFQQLLVLASGCWHVRSRWPRDCVLQWRFILDCLYVLAGISDSVRVCLRPQELCTRFGSGLAHADIGASVWRGGLWWVGPRIVLPLRDIFLKVSTTAKTAPRQQCNDFREAPAAAVSSSHRTSGTSCVWSVAAERSYFIWGSLFRLCWAFCTSAEVLSL